MTKGERFVELLEEFMDTRDMIRYQKSQHGYASDHYTDALHRIGREIAEIVDSVSK